MEHTHFLASAILPRAPVSTRTPDQIDAFYEGNGCEVWTCFARLPERLRTLFTKRDEDQKATRHFANTASAR